MCKDAEINKGERRAVVSGRPPGCLCDETCSTFSKLQSQTVQRVSRPGVCSIMDSSPSPAVDRIVSGPPDDAAANQSPVGMRRSTSWLWFWKGATPPITPDSSRGPSRNGSQHNGQHFGASCNGSQHNGQHFGHSTHSPVMGNSKRNASFSDLAGMPLTDDPTRQVPRSRESSAHGGSLWKLMGGGSMQSLVVVGEDKEAPGASSYWDWMSRTPPSSRNSSVHGGDNFAPEKEQGLRRNSSFGFMWDWAKGRISGPQTPGSSRHGGSAFAPEGSDAQKSREELEDRIPGAMRRNMSLGSFGACSMGSKSWRDPALISICGVSTCVPVLGNSHARLR